MGEFKRKKIVCFGGGTGLPSLLSGLKANPWLEITAVVSMFDSGGSSGVLRDRFGILPPGDVLKCLLALSSDSVRAREILLRRIKHPVHDGHTGGNILLMGLEQVYGGYEDAVNALGQLLAVSGRVVPVSLDKSALCSESTDGSVAFGEAEVDAKIQAGSHLKRLFLEPAAGATASAVKAISEADAIIVGPGSFYTSIMPNFLPTGIASAVGSAPAPMVFVANLVTEGSGMNGMALSDMVSFFEARIGRRVDAIVANSAILPAALLAEYAKENKEPLRLGAVGNDKRLISAELWTDGSIARHDPARLASVVCTAIDRIEKR